MQEYENDRWRIISSKVGSGFSPAACRDKAEELQAVELAQQEAQEGEHSQLQHQSAYAPSQMGPDSSDSGARYH